MMARSYAWIAGLVVALMLPGLLPAQTLDLTKRFQVISRKNVDKLQDDLNEAGQNGIRVVTGSDTAGDRVALLLEKSEHKGVTYEYLVISESKANKIEQRLSLIFRETAEGLAFDMVGDRGGEPEFVDVGPAADLSGEPLGFEVENNNRVIHREVPRFFGPAVVTGRTILERRSG